MDQNKEIEKKLKRLQEDYKIVFGSEEGQRVLEDISIRCHERTTTFSKENSHETAFFDGQRTILLFIKAMIKKK